MKKTILLASGQQAIDNAISKFEGYDVLGRLEYKNELEQACSEWKPQIILVGEGLGGYESLTEVILKLVKEFPKMRIIYLAGYVDVRDEPKMNSLGMLVMAGVYDIVHEQKINAQILKHLLDVPKKPEQMEYLTKRVKSSIDKAKVVIDFDIPEEDENKDEGIIENLFVVSSIKPGTGKSFLSTNVATAIANFGVNTKDGKRPRVALIEADLQNLSVGTLLGIEDDKKNLKSVMEKISTIVSQNGDFLGNLQQVESVTEYIKSCFKPYYRVRNLEALVGSQLKYSELEDIQPFYYIYLVEALMDEFDVIIVDTNSSMAHITTAPLLRLAKSCYYILNLDFNNVRNNARYKDTLSEIGISHKVKYVLNEDIKDRDDSSNGSDIEELIFTADHLDDSEFKLEARIPLLPKTVFLNRLYEGTPIVLDDNKYTLKARYEIMKIANQIYPIKNLKELEDEVEKTKGKKKKGLF